MFPFIVVAAVDVAVKNIGKEGVQQWVSATLFQSYKIYSLLLLLLLLLLNIIVCACVRACARALAPVFLPYLSLMQISSFLCRHL